MNEFDASKCGTYAGYNQHNKKKVVMCDACREANAAYMKERRQSSAYQKRYDKAYAKARFLASQELVKLHPGQYQILLDNAIDEAMKEIE